MKTIMEGKQIIKTFGEGNDKRTVLDQVSVEVMEGEFISVMGPSGSGKSTLLFALSGMDSFDSGKVVFDGRDLSAVNEKELADIRRKEMGFVFQQPTMLKNLNIIDNIVLPSIRDQRKNASMLTDRARKLMDKVGIGELGGRDITQVSGGQLQRAGICRALMNSPKIVFGDEPTGALNSKSTEEIMEILAAINKEGTAIMLVTHDAKVAAKTDRVMLMSDGRIVDELQLSQYKGTSMERRIKMVMDKMNTIGI